MRNAGSVILFDMQLRAQRERRRRETPSTTQMRARRLLAARALGRHTDNEWRALLVECEFTCVRCGFYGWDPLNPRGHVLTKDHITPLHMGGSDSIDNIQPLCVTCNCSKRSETTNWLSRRRDTAKAA